MKSNDKGFTLTELLSVMGIVGLLATVAVPAFAQYKARALDSEAKSHLQHAFRACKGYWLENGGSSSCSVPIASAPAYGYVQTATVNITTSGGETTFSGTAFHVDSGNTYTIDATGSIN